ncbi:MAG: glycoside hydrolase family 78 protein [Eubacterium sp.]|nr:glycoside hydrolase family 78 protein [Eubacterium sp.]
MKLTELRVCNLNSPLGFQLNPLSFSWKVEDAGKAKKQSWARVRVFQEDGKGGCISGSGQDGKDICIYDSGQDADADSLDDPVQAQLLPRTRYRFHIEVMADNGESASASSSFETGKMQEAWAASWITADLDADTPAVLAKTFTAKKSGAARLYICGLGVYEVYLNGKKAGEEYLAPGYHSYDFHLQVHTYDVSDLLCDGENEIQVWLGDGWYRGRLGFDGGYTNVYGDRCFAIAELYTEDGLVLATDESWRSKESPVVFSNIYDGEIYDAPVADKLAQQEGWHGVRLEAPQRCGALEDRVGLAVVKKETFPVAEQIHTPKGETVLDFGQELTGWVEMECQLEQGMQIRLTAAEILQDGCFYNENYRTAKTQFTYRPDGQRRHVRPHFTFFGFRYMKVEYLDADGNLTEPGAQALPKEAFTAVHLRSDFDEAGCIRTGQEKVNRLFSNALWGQKDNFLDVPTDCPQRDERLGWTGDAQVFCETACYNMYMPAFYRKYLWDMRAEQSVLGGSVPNVVPRLKHGMVAEHGSCPWADAGVIIPWKVYEHYGSRTLLRECYPGMKAWVEYERKKEEALGGLHLIKDGFHFADWLALDNPQPGPFGATDPLYIASTFYYYCVKSVALAAAELSYEADAAEFSRLAEEILAAIRETYFDQEGRCNCQTQTGLALALAYGLIPSQAGIKQAGDMLAVKIAANNGHLDTGFVGTSILCPALTESGHHQTAVDLLLNEEFPGWLYCVNLGATTIWERWDSVLADGKISEEGMNSLNHYSYGSIEAWMYKYVCGIRPAKPGFRQAYMKPHPDARLGFAECTLHTAAGTYKSSWRYEKDGTVTYEVEVPFGAQAEFVLGEKRQVLAAGAYTFHA